MIPDEFIRNILPGAQALQREFGILASLTIAQAAQESGWGSSVPYDKLSGKFSYNLFGIKGTGTAGSVTWPTWEMVNGRRIEINAQFRAYNSYEESMRDHHELLMLDRYAPVRNAPDSEEAAHQLYTCGYATDPGYANSLISIIHKYNLVQYDVPKIEVPKKQPSELTHSINQPDKFVNARRQKWRHFRKLFG